MKYTAGKCLMFRKAAGHQMASEQCAKRKAGQEVLRKSQGTQSKYFQTTYNRGPIYP